jgi:SAM-dependent methyltransferase
MSDEGIYAPPRHVTDLGECSFYHVTDLPGHGVVGFGWDLRGGEDEYLGHVDFRGKRVLELGTSSGFLCRYMESKGAAVVGYDLSEEHSWDSVHFSQCDMSSYLLELKTYLRLQSNAWWLAHRLFNSTARAVYGHVYSIPAQIGPVDISTFGSLLLHVRDPFLALQNALRLTRESVIITDLHPQQPDDPHAAESRPAMRFLPNFRVAQSASSSSWWALSPELVIEFLGVLGFEKTEVTVHFQKYVDPKAKLMRLFTVVGTRTREMAAIP